MVGAFGISDDADEQQQDGDVVEHEAEEGVDVARRGPAVASHGGNGGGLGEIKKPR